MRPEDAGLKTHIQRRTVQSKKFRFSWSRVPLKDGEVARLEQLILIVPIPLMKYIASHMAG